MNALKHLAEKLHHHDKHAHDNKIEETHTHEHVKTASEPSLKKEPVLVTETTTTTKAPSQSLHHHNDKKVIFDEPALSKKENVVVTETIDYETVTIAPVIDEKVRTDVLVEVQPVVHKEIEQPVVHHIEKHITEAPEASRAAEVTLAPKIIEHVHTHIIEEVQPIIHREVAVQRVEKLTEVRTEHVNAPAQHVNEVTHESLSSKGKVDLHSHTANTHIAKPIIDEKVRTDILVEVQPVVHRDIEKTIVNHVEKHITEAPAPSLAGRVQLAPKVEERVHVHEMADVQPIIHREKAVLKVDRVEQDITEHVTAPTSHTHEVVREKSAGAFVPLVSNDNEHIYKAPIIDEKVRTDVLVEVQPVIKRDIDQDIVHHVERHIDEAPAPSLAGTVTLAPKIEERVHTHVVNEVQPVVHREVSQQKVERVEEHLTERVVAPATHTHEVLNERSANGKYLSETSSADKHVHAPIVDEKLRTDVLVEVQPIVHKEIDQEVVRHVERHITEAPAPSLAGTVQLAPKVEEKVHSHVINEIQPIVHREKAVRVVEHKEDHLTEKIVAPTTHTHEKVVEKNIVKPSIAMQAGGQPSVTPL